jgi:hypothetical protein
MTGIERHEIERRLERIEHDVKQIQQSVWQIVHLLHHQTPNLITFKEITMLPPVAGNTLVYTGAIAPAGAQFPAGTTFTVTSSDSTVTPTVDETGLVVTIPLPSTFVDNPASPFNVVWATSIFTPNPSTSPEGLTVTITPSIPVTVLTPTAVTFQQTT